jgi:hypothetical protein
MAAVNAATGAILEVYGAPVLAAFEGREAEAVQLIETATNEAVRRARNRG